MNNQLENPVAQGNPDELFRDAPEQEIRCPHCGAIWGLRTIQPDAYHDYQLFDWETSDGKHECSTRDGSASPISTDCCYACAIEHNADDALIEYCETNNRKELAAWIANMDDAECLNEDATRIIIDYTKEEISSEIWGDGVPGDECEAAAKREWCQLLRDFVSDFGPDEFREWRVFNA